MDFLDKGPKQRNMNMRFGTWNVRRLYTVGSLMTVLRELSRYRLDLVGMQEVRWEGNGTVPAGGKHFSTERGMRTMNWVQVFLYVRESYQQLRGLSLLMIGMSYIILRGWWFHIIVLNVHASTEDKTDDVKDGFYEELERIFDKFPKYHMKILLGDLNAKVGREDIFKPTTGNESLHEISNDNVVRVVNFATSKNPIVKSTMFPHLNIHIYILGHLQMRTPTIRLTIS
jgi:exonuclease III